MEGHAIAILAQTILAQDVFSLLFSIPCKMLLHAAQGMAHGAGSRWLAPGVARAETTRGEMVQGNPTDKERSLSVTFQTRSGRRAVCGRPPHLRHTSKPPVQVAADAVGEIERLKAAIAALGEQKALYEAEVAEAATVDAPPVAPQVTNFRNGSLRWCWKATLCAQPQ